MNRIPEDLLYDRGHVWLALGENLTGSMGITDFLQQLMGPITFVQLPELGEKLTANRPFGVVESTGGSRQLIAPADAEVIEINMRLEREPDLCNADPYGAGWIARLRLTATPADLLNADAYRIYCETEKD